MTIRLEFSIWAFLYHERKRSIWLLEYWRRPTSNMPFKTDNYIQRTLRPLSHCGYSHANGRREQGDCLLTFCRIRSVWRFSMNQTTWVIILKQYRADYVRSISCWIMCHLWTRRSSCQGSFWQSAWGRWRFEEHLSFDMFEEMDRSTDLIAIWHCFFCFLSVNHRGTTIIIIIRDKGFHHFFYQTKLDKTKSLSHWVGNGSRSSMTFWRNVDWKSSLLRLVMAQSAVWNISDGPFSWKWSVFPRRDSSISSSSIQLPPSLRRRPTTGTVSFKHRCSRPSSSTT